MDRAHPRHRWGRTGATDFASDSIGLVEDEVLDAARLEAERPSFENLPEDGREVVRVVAIRWAARHGSANFSAGARSCAISARSAAGLSSTWAQFEI
jgi:hypothetical protein